MGRERVKKDVPMRPPIIDDKNAALKALRGLALLGQRMTIENCHGGRGGTWCADQHRGDSIGSMDHRQRSDQQDHRRVNVERINERQQDGDAGDAAQAGQDADDRAGQHAGHQHAIVKRIGEPLKRD